jgi:hypothetical protein
MERQGGGAAGDRVGALSPSDAEITRFADEVDRLGVVRLHFTTAGSPGGVPTGPPSSSIDIRTATAISVYR